MEKITKEKEKKQNLRRCVPVPLESYHSSTSVESYAILDGCANVSLEFLNIVSEEIFTTLQISENLTYDASRAVIDHVKPNNRRRCSNIGF
jgi:hypothetical protein